MPPYRVGGEQVCEELGDDAQAVRLEAVDGFVVVREALFKEIGPHAVDFAEALADHTVELLVGTLLTGALDNHGCELVFQTVR